MSWKHWPYWLKGGIISAVIGLFFFALAERCGHSAAISGNEDFRCIPLLGPAFLLAVVVGIIPGLKPLLHFIPDVMLYLILIVVAWFLSGAMIGALIGYKKSKKERLP